MSTYGVYVSFTRYYQKVSKGCPVCHKEFTGIKKQVYCRLSCRNRAHYQRKQDRLARASHHNRA